MAGRNKLKYWLLSGVALASATTSCATTGTTQSPFETLANRDVAVSTITGATMGAVIGGVIGNNVGDGDATRGALIGAAIGGLVGANMGVIASRRRAAYETETAFLDSEINAANSAIESKSDQLADARLELSEPQERIALLRTSNRRDQNVAASLNSMASDLQTRLTQYDGTLTVYQQSINYIDEVIETSEPRPGDSVADLEMRKASLLDRRTALVAQFNELNGIKDDTQIAFNDVVALGGTPV